MFAGSICGMKRTTKNILSMISMGKKHVNVVEHKEEEEF
jgi:hypothetical protein